MKKMTIKSIDRNLYKLIDNQNREYQLNLEFIGSNKPLKENDIIEISMELLNPYSNVYSSFYTFGKLDDITGRKNVSITDIDVIKIIIDNKEIYMKRLYG